MDTQPDPLNLPKRENPEEAGRHLGEFIQNPVPILDSPGFFSEFSHVFGPWITVASAAAKLAFALKNVSTAAPVIDLVLALSGVSDAQTKLLQSIKADTLLLRQEPLQTAATLMGEARRFGPNDKRYRKFLEDAAESLYRAKSLAASSEELAVVQFGLACAYLTMELPKDSQYWVEQSVQSERTVLDALLGKRIGLGIGFWGRERVIDKRENPDAREKTEPLWRTIRERVIDKLENPDAREKTEPLWRTIRERVADKLENPDAYEKTEPLWRTIRERVADKRENPDAYEKTEPLWRTVADITYGSAMAYTGVLTLGATTAGQAVVGRKIREQQIERLRRFLYFANSIEVSNDAIFGRAATKILELEMVEDPPQPDELGLIKPKGQHWYLRERRFDF